MKPVPNYRVRAPLTVDGDGTARAVRDLLLDGLRGFGLEARVKAEDEEVIATIEVAASSPGEAKRKASYWLQRAADRVSTRRRRLTPSGGTRKMTVEELG
jgi:hypothetical protein